MRKGEKRPDLQRARIGTCVICGKEFRAVKDYKNRKQKYCSKECWSKRGTIINHCKYCGKEIKTYKSVNKQYCNNECRNLAFRETQKGEKSHFWKGGKTKASKLKRTSAEYKEWRKKVFERDNFTCQNCGKTGRDIEAHHIKEQSRYPELIYDVNNGLTLCHKCHKETDNYGVKVQHKKQMIYYLIAMERETELLNIESLTIIGINATQLPQTTSEDIIINIGYCGSNKIKVGTIVEPNRVVDLKTKEETTLNGKDNVVCFTSDTFVEQAHTQQECIYDMELSKIAKLPHKTIYAIKIVSDNLNEKDCENFDNQKIAEQINEKIKNIISLLEMPF